MRDDELRRLPVWLRRSYSVLSSRLDALEDPTRAAEICSAFRDILGRVLEKTRCEEYHGPLNRLGNQLSETAEVLRGVAETEGLFREESDEY